MSWLLRRRRILSGGNSVSAYPPLNVMRWSDGTPIRWVYNGHYIKWGG